MLFLNNILRPALSLQRFLFRNKGFPPLFFLIQYLIAFIIPVIKNLAGKGVPFFYLIFTLFDLNA